MVALLKLGPQQNPSNMSMNMSSLAEETGGAVSGAGGGASWPVSIDLGVIAHHIHILMGLAILAEVKFLVA